MRPSVSIGKATKVAGATIAMKKTIAPTGIVVDTANAARTKSFNGMDSFLRLYKQNIE